MNIVRILDIKVPISMEKIKEFIKEDGFELSDKYDIKEKDGLCYGSIVCEKLKE